MFFKKSERNAMLLIPMELLHELEESIARNLFNNGIKFYLAKEEIEQMKKDYEVV